MKIKFRIVTIMLALCFVFAFVLLFVENGGVEGENREKTPFPKLTAQNIKSGKFSSEFEAFLGDGIGLRSEFIKLSQRLNSFKGITSPKGRVIRADIDKGTGKKQSSNLLVLDDAVMEMFEKNEKAEAEYAAAVNELAENIGENVKLYCMLVPTRLEFCKEMYSNLQDSQKDAIDRITAAIEEKTETIDVYDTLKEHRDEYIYFRTDHHWTMLGSYYGYKRFCRQTGQRYVDIDDYRKNKQEGFVGYLYAFSDTPELKEKPDTIEWYDVNTRGNIDWTMTSFDEDGTKHPYKSVLYDKKSNTYDFFLGSDHALAVYTNSELPKGKTIILICDSYANDFAPWLMNNYKNVILIDPRSYKDRLRNTIKQYKPDEIMFLNYIFTVSFEDYCKIIKNFY